MNDGLLIGCYAAHLGAVPVDEGTFYMNGGSIRECSASAISPDGVYLTQGSVMHANGGEVDGFVLVEEKSRLIGGTGLTGVTAFRSRAKVDTDATIEYGIYYGELTVGWGGSLSGVTVTYMDGETEYAKQVLQSGSPATRPDDPAAEIGKIFDGWFRSDGTAWDYASHTVTEDITLYARRTACTHESHTGAQPTCTDTAICTVCGGTIPATGHDWGAWSSNGNDTHTRTCRHDSAHTETKDCSGGEATCRAEAVCTVCGGSHGGLNASNHKDGIQEWHKTPTAHEKKWSCCGAVTVASEAHAWTDGVCGTCGYACLHDDTDHDHICDECNVIISNHEDANRDHVCDLCGKAISNHEDAKHDHVCDFCGKTVSSHSGGGANCTEQAVCEICQNAYGEPDAANHTNLIHFPAKAATEDAEGNIEYWYCDGCGQYFSDAEATRAITAADTVTEKLPHTPQVPQTDNSGSLLPWIALLFVSGGVCTVLTVKRRKITSTRR